MTVTENGTLDRHCRAPGNDSAERLEPCPWCGSDMSSFVAAADGCCTSSNGSLYVPCDCGAMGPEGKTVAGAIAAWNRRAPAAGAPEGWKLVPVELTQEMESAYTHEYMRCASEQIHYFVAKRMAYRAMLDAAPAAPKEKP